MAAVRRLCTRGILLRQGNVEVDAETDRMITAYLAAGQTASTDPSSWHFRHRGERVRIESVEVIVNGKPTANVEAGDQVTFRMRYRTMTPAAVVNDYSVCVILYAQGQRLTNLWTNGPPGRGLGVAESGTIDCVVPRWPFREGIFRVDLYCHIGLDMQDVIDECARFDSHDGDFYGTGMIPDPLGDLALLEHEWSTAPD